VLTLSRKESEALVETVFAFVAKTTVSEAVRAIIFPLQ
jgi:hypothetical protein